MRLDGIALAVVALFLAGCAGVEEESAAPSAMEPKLVDLTHAFDEDTLVWPTSRRFEIEPVFVGEDPRGFHYEAYEFATAEHGGTHLDAPVHFFADRQTADEVPLERLVGPGAVVDVSAQCDADPDYRVTPADLQAWEASYGSLDGRIVLLRTGFGERWPDAEAYLGTSDRGPEAVAELHFPGLHPDAARWLVAEREILAIGLDTPSIDYGQSQDFASHVTLFEHNVPAFENVANLAALPADGFQVIALPMKIKGGSGAPLRIIAIVEAQ